jgi:hypothetical protein
MAPFQRSANKTLLCKPFTAASPEHNTSAFTGKATLLMTEQQHQASSAQLHAHSIASTAASSFPSASVAPMHQSHTTTALMYTVNLDQSLNVHYIDATLQAAQFTPCAYTLPQLPVSNHCLVQTAAVTAVQWFHAVHQCNDTSLARCGTAPASCQAATQPPSSPLPLPLVRTQQRCHAPSCAPLKPFCCCHCLLPCLVRPACCPAQYHPKHHACQIID